MRGAGRTAAATATAAVAMGLVVASFHTEAPAAPAAPAASPARAPWGALAAAVDRAEQDGTVGFAAVVDRGPGVDALTYSGVIDSRHRRVHVEDRSDGRLEVIATEERIYTRDGDWPRGFRERWATREHAMGYAANSVLEILTRVTGTEVDRSLWHRTVHGRMWAVDALNLMGVGQLVAAELGLPARPHDLVEVRVGLDHEGRPESLSFRGSDIPADPMWPAGLRESVAASRVDVTLSGYGTEPAVDMPGRDEVLGAAEQALLSSGAELTDT
jgi:hypothetical protein